MEILKGIRPDLRAPDTLRSVSIELDVAPNATGSVLIRFGETQVICAANLEKKIPSWMQHQGISGGWITAEYTMLPYSTLERKPRDSSKGKQDGRSVEIQRLIGRSIRAVFDLKKLHSYTLWLDCDVLQADGGTRTAAITGSYLAAKIAVNRLIQKGELHNDPFRDSVAAVSAGLYQEQPVLDLNYIEDRDASVDFNVVMSGGGQFIELQGTGETATFSREQLNTLIDLAQKGIRELTLIQNQVLEKTEKMYSKN